MYLNSNVKDLIKSLNKNIPFKEPINKSYNLFNFILDTSASKHIVSNKEFLIHYRPINIIIGWGKASYLKVTGIRNLIISFNNKQKHYLKSVYYVLEIGVNIISQSNLNTTTIIKNNNLLLFDSKGNFIT